MYEIDPAPRQRPRAAPLRLVLLATALFLVLPFDAWLLSRFGRSFLAYRTATWLSLIFWLCVLVGSLFAWGSATCFGCVY